MTFTDTLTELLSHLTSRAIVDILVVAVGVYYLLRLLRGARAVQTIAVVLLLVCFYQIALWARLEMVEWLLATMAPYAAIALIVLFQPEIRRALGVLAAPYSMTWCWQQTTSRRTTSER
jgi:diadenylate cyclase